MLCKPFAMHAGWQPARLLDRLQKGKEQSLRIKENGVALNTQTLSLQKYTKPSSQSVPASKIGASSTAEGSTRSLLVPSPKRGNLPSQSRHIHAWIKHCDTSQACSSVALKVRMSRFDSAI